MAKRADLKNKAAELRDRFNSAATELDKHPGNVNIARVAGGVLEFLDGGKLIANVTPSVSFNHCIFDHL